METGFFYYYFCFMNEINIREIQLADNAIIASIIRNTLSEFGANRPGTVYFDTTTDALFELFQKRGAGYFVATLNNQVVGGAGIYPTDGLPADTCELVKMYLLPEVRSKGLGRTLIEKNLNFAREAGYKNVYLETMPELNQALKVYARFGFELPKGADGKQRTYGL